MNRLWAPWRIKYVSRKTPKGCLFCRIVKARQDAKNLVLMRSRECFALLNAFPYNNGHIMIVPNRHIKSLEQISEQELLSIHNTILKIKLALSKILKPDGFNIGINIGKTSGAGIAGHLHIHIVPRWLGDTNFMPVLSGTKIISQSLDELYGLFKKL